MGGVAKLEGATPMRLCHFPSKSVSPEAYQRGVGTSLPKTMQKRSEERDQRPYSMLASDRGRDVNTRGVNRAAKVDHADNKKRSTFRYHRVSDGSNRPARPPPKAPSTVPSNGPPSGPVHITVNAPIIHRPVPLRASEYGPPAHEWNIKSPASTPAPPSQPSVTGGETKLQPLLPRPVPPHIPSSAPSTCTRIRGNEAPPHSVLQPRAVLNHVGGHGLDPNLLNHCLRRPGPEHTKFPPVHET